MTSAWKPYSVQAKLHTMDVLAKSCDRGYRWRLSTHATPGTKGDGKGKHGRESIVDRVVVLLTVPEVDQLVKIADREAPVVWTHPLLSPITGHVEDLDLPGNRDVDGYFMASFNFVQAYDPEVAESMQPGVLSPAGSQKKASGLFDNLLADLDGLDDIPTTANGTTFTNSAAALGTAFADVDAAFDTITDPAGDGTWRDLSRTLDTFTQAADIFIDAAREIEDSVGALSYQIQTAPLLIRETVGDAVDNLKAPAGVVASFVTTEPSDLFAMMMDAGVEITEANIVALMEDNGIGDPLFISAGLTIAIPVAG